jgi:membrane fusion protein, multidrug efflux system
LAQKRDVTFDRTYNGQAEILSGLKAGDQLITEGFADLNIGDEVQAK